MQIHLTKNPIVTLFLLDHGWRAIAKESRGRRLTVTLAKEETSTLAGVPLSPECEDMARDAMQPEQKEQLTTN